MKLLVIGSGGREDALVWKLAQSPHATQMWCAPGNAGIAQEKKIDLSVGGPDNPLALGIVDLFQANRLKIWGVNQKAAQFESSKVFSQKFMEKYGIPTAQAGTFD